MFPFILYFFQNIIKCMLLIVYVQMLFICIASFLFYKYMASLTLVLFCHYGGIVVKVKKKKKNIFHLAVC